MAIRFSPQRAPGDRSSTLNSVGFAPVVKVPRTGTCAVEGRKRKNVKKNLKDNIGAIEDFNKAIILNPEYENAYYYRGLMKADLKYYKEAIPDFTKVIEINPQFAKAYFYRGVTKFMIEGKTKSACIDLSKALELGESSASDLALIKEICQ